MEESFFVLSNLRNFHKVYLKKLKPQSHIAPGHGLCPGCGAGACLKQLALGATQVYGDNMIFTDAFIQLFFVFLIMFFVIASNNSKIGTGILTGLNLMILLKIIASGAAELSTMNYIIFLLLFASLEVFGVSRLRQ